jgi:uncharacterized protein
VNIPEYIIIAAGSGGMLAQAVKKSGRKPLVIDLFADQDTQEIAEDFRPITSLAVEHVAPAIDYFVNNYPAADLIYGSGFEYHPESLSYLHSRLNIIGNDPASFGNILNKKHFFSVLDRLEIAHPEVCFSPPVHEDDWLVKPMLGQGGLGIRHYRQGDAACSSVYWQKYLTGIPYSVLFLANGQETQFIGFNRQWTTALSESEAFVFSGVMTCTDLPNQQERMMSDILNKLVSVLNLKGLNSLDFIQVGNKCHVLEINPRPSASMQLYDGDLLSAHIFACRGLFAGALPIQSGYKGYQIVYALKDLMIPDLFEWPDGCMDLPCAGAIIRTGQPICSIISHQNKAQDVLKQLSSKQSIIINTLERFQSHAI